MSEPTSSPPSRYALPGFGLPLNFTPIVGATTTTYDNVLKRTVKKTVPAVGEWGPLFPSALDNEIRPKFTTLREFTMMRFMNQLTDKSGWDTKVFDEKIVAKWKTEALANSDIDMTETMFTYCIEELKYKSKVFQETGTVSVYNGDVVKSDNSIPSSLRDALRTAAKPLEDIPEVLRDWHPGSNDTVLDLVHPSLFPLVYGRTRILKDSFVGLGDCVLRCGQGEMSSVPSVEEAQLLGVNLYGFGPVLDPFSRKFQWLPCEIEFKDDKPKITSYINNLHPQAHQSLYKVIEQIIQLTIPLWNQTLTPLEKESHSNPRIAYSACEYDPDPETFPEEEQPQMRPHESHVDFWNRKEAWAQDIRRVVKPEPPPFKAPKEGQKRTDLKHDFGKRGLQIIVKLANIQLTPEKPEYAGGTWHVEGQMNEHICATALYYYDTSNITESLLSFRQQSEIEDADDVSYEQQHHDWLSVVFGCEQDGPALQYIGDVIAKEGRLLTFPNIFQHRVAPFALVDKAKPGHRKILALFLVDPHIRIISTANVPCQQREWWAQELRDEKGFQKLPNEMMKEIVDHVDEFPIGMDEAKELRIELMEERKNYVQRHDDLWHSDVFSLCEH